MGERDGKRFSDEMLIRLDQKFEDTLKWAQTQDIDKEARLVALENFVKTIERPVAAAGWTIITFMAAFLAAFAWFLWKLLSLKLHWG